MRSFALALVLLAGAAARAAAPDPGIAAIYWEPPGHPAVGASARAAFADASRPLGAVFADASAEVPPPPPSLAPPLENARAAYERFAFADALSALDDLQRVAELRGGGDLNSRQLSEIYFYRGLGRLETGAAESAWDDLVRAARLDPARVVDPARFPPRAVAAYKRAAAEVATLPHADLELAVPPSAVVRVDGAFAAGMVGVTLGPHFVSVQAVGYEPWASVVTVTGVKQRLSPPLRAQQAPDVDALLAATGQTAAHRVLLGALERAAGGTWRFVVRDIELPDGKVVSAQASLADAPVSVTVSGLVRRLVTSPPPTATERPRWHYWAMAGAAALLVAASVSLAVIVRDPGSPNVAGDLGTWR